MSVNYDYQSKKWAVCAECGYRQPVEYGRRWARPPGWRIRSVPGRFTKTVMRLFCDMCEPRPYGRYR